MTQQRTPGRGLRAAGPALLLAATLSGCGPLSGFFKKTGQKPELVHSSAVEASPSTLSSERISNEAVYLKLKALFPRTLQLRREQVEGLDFNAKTGADLTPPELSGVIRRDRPMGPVALSQFHLYVARECRAAIASADAANPLSDTGLLSADRAIPTSERAAFAKMPFRERLLLVMARNAFGSPIDPGAPEIQTLRRTLAEIEALPAVAKATEKLGTGAAPDRVAREAAIALCAALANSPQFFFGFAGSGREYADLALRLFDTVLTPVQVAELSARPGYGVSAYFDELFSRADNRKLALGRLTQWMGEAYGIDPTRLQKPDEDLRWTNGPPASQHQGAFGTLTEGARADRAPVLFARRYIEERDFGTDTRLPFTESIRTEVEQPFDPRTSMILQEYNETGQPAGWQVAGGWVERRFLPQYLQRLSSYVAHPWRLDDRSRVVDASGAEGLCAPVSWEHPRFKCMDPRTLQLNQTCWFLQEARDAGVEFYSCKGYVRRAGSPGGSDLPQFVLTDFEKIRAPKVRRLDGTPAEGLDWGRSRPPFNLQLEADGSGIDQTFAASLPEGAVARGQLHFLQTPRIRTQRYGYPDPQGRIEAQDGVSRIRMWYSGEAVFVPNNIDRMILSCQYAAPVHRTGYEGGEYFGNLMSAWREGWFQTLGDWALVRAPATYTPWDNSYAEARSFLNPLSILSFRCGQPRADLLADTGADPRSRYPLGHRFGAGVDASLIDIAYFARGFGGPETAQGAREKAVTDRMWADLQNESRRLMAHLMLTRRHWSELFTARYKIGSAALARVYSEKGYLRMLPPTSEAEHRQSGFQAEPARELSAVEGEPLFIYDLERAPEIPVGQLINGSLTTGYHYGYYHAAWDSESSYTPDYRGSYGYGTWAVCWHEKYNFTQARQCWEATHPGRNANDLRVRSIEPGVGVLGNLDVIGPVTFYAGNLIRVSARTVVRRFTERFLGAPAPSTLLAAASPADRAAALAMIASELNQQNRAHVKPECASCHAVMDPLAFAMFAGSRSSMLANRGGYQEVAGPYFNYMNYASPVVAGRLPASNQPEGYFPGKGRIRGLRGAAEALGGARAFYEQTVTIVHERLYGRRPLTPQALRHFDQLVTRFQKDGDFLAMVRSLAFTESFQREKGK